MYREETSNHTLKIHMKPCQRFGRYIFFKHRKLAKIPILTNIFQRDWFNHQPGDNFQVPGSRVYPVMKILFPIQSDGTAWRVLYISEHLRFYILYGQNRWHRYQKLEGRLEKGPYKPICRDCAIYFLITVSG